MAPQERDPTCKELRLGLVMYGGVSLAIYIYGVAYEFLRLARKEGVYQELVHKAGVIPIIDIISGTSAGGINGLILAKALAVGGDLSPLKDLWIEEGDLQKLINIDDPKPLSLLNSSYYEKKIREALKQVQQTKGTHPPPSFPLDLFITATDLDGVVTEWAGPYFGRAIVSKQYGTVFHFKVRPSYDLFKEFSEEIWQDSQVPWERIKQVLGDDRSPRNDFDPDISPRTDGDVSQSGAAETDKDYYLAKVAASTSAFPVAFAPVAFKPDEIKMMRTLFSPNTLGGSQGGSVKEDQAAVYGDGGMVNNKPFNYTIETIFHRHATGPVDRKLIFVEPDPASLEGGSRLASQSAVDGLDSLQRFVSASFYESVTTDLATVIARNQRIEDVQGMLDFLEKELKKFLNKSRGRLRAGYEDQAIYPAYRQLKVERLRRELEQRLLGSAAGSGDLTLAQQKLLDEFYKLLVQEYGNFKDEAQTSRFLQTFDYPFRIRRIRYFIKKINAWLNEINRLADTFQEEDRQTVTQLQETLSDLKAKLYVFVEVYNHQVWHIWAKEIAQKEARVTAGESNLIQTFSQVEKKYQDLMNTPTEERQQAQVAADQPVLDYKTLTLEALQSEQMVQAVGQLKALQQDYPSLRPLLDAVFDNWAEEDFDARAEVRQVFNAYEFLDMYLYPTMILADVGEADPIEVIRVSPTDALRYKDNVASKLAGEKLMHFSAFLKKTWRENDVLWGRLDAAEIILRTLLPDQPSEALLGRLLQEILREEFTDIIARRKSEVSWTVLTANQRAEISRILDELVELETGNKRQPDSEKATALPPGEKQEIRRLDQLEGPALEKYFRERHTVGAEDLKAISQDYLLKTTVMSLRTMEKVFQRRSEKTEATGLQRLIRGFGILFHLPYTFVVTLGGAEESRFSTRVFNFLVLLGTVLLALHALEALQAERWLLLIAAALLILRFWSYLLYLVREWVKYAVLFLALLLLVGSGLFWSEAIRIREPATVRYAGLALLGLFLLVSFITWFWSKRKGAGQTEG